MKLLKSLLTILAIVTVTSLVAGAADHKQVKKSPDSHGSIAGSPSARDCLNTINTASGVAAERADGVFSIEALKVVSDVEGHLIACANSPHTDRNLMYSLFDAEVRLSGAKQAWLASLDLRGDVREVAADQKPPEFYFGGKRLFVGMPKSEAVESLSACCKLSPSAYPAIEKSPGGSMGGHFILPKEESPSRILGSVFFAGGKVTGIKRTLAEDVDTSSDDVVGFVRALHRALSPVTGDTEATLHVSVRHMRLANAEADFLTLSFPNGRGVELQIGTLDKPNEHTNKRDFVGLDETLAPPRQE